MAAPSREKIAVREAEVMKLAASGQREKARDLLIELTVSCARGGDLSSANRLRDLLYEVDPMALREIIKVNELIEEVMAGSVDEQFNQAWAGLREMLANEEFTSLYHALEMHDVAHGKTLVQIGSRLDVLFMCNKGSLNVVCRAGENNVVCKVLEPGDLHGENFFQPSLWTVALVSLSPATLGILRLERLAELEGRIPGIASKLLRYYEKINDIPRLLKKQNISRRRLPRFRSDCRMTFQVLDRDGKPDERSFKGELHSIGQGGLSFLLRIVKKENRRMIFGRRLVIALPLPGGSLSLSGTVVAVTLHDPQEQDYAVHVAFARPVQESEIKHLILPEPEPLEESTEEGQERPSEGDASPVQ